MWNYEKRLEYPVNITRCDPKAAMVIISQYGGPDGEIGASMRYLSQRYSMENRIAAGTLTDIGVSVAKLRMGIVREMGNCRTPHVNKGLAPPGYANKQPS